MEPNDEDLNIDSSADARDAAGPEPSPPGRPRVWTVFVAIVVALFTTVAVQAAVAAAIVAWHVSQGAEIEDLVEALPAKLATPSMFMLLGLPSQLAMGLTAVVAARLSPRPALSRIGLVRTALPARVHLVFMIGALFPLAIGVTLAEWIALVIPPDPYAGMLYEQMTLRWVVPHVLFVALAPAFMEEFLFRGYVQTRLLRRWSPWLAILVTSTLFGLFHITPHAIANAFVIGLWLGVLAWRTGSIWPAIFGHAFINGVWNIWNAGVVVWGFPEKPPALVAVCGGAVIIACFLWSLWILRVKCHPPELEERPAT